MQDRSHLSDPDRVAASMRRELAKTNGDSEWEERQAIREESLPGELRGLRHLGPIMVVGLPTLTELASAVVDFAWQDISPVGTITLIAGDPGCGKTTLLFLVLCGRAHVELGDPVFLLGRKIAAAPARQYIVLIEGEHSESSAARKLLRSCRLLGIGQAGLERVVLVARKALQLGSPAWGDLEKVVRQGVISDIALDTIARIAPANANDEREQVAIFDHIARLIEMAPGPRKPTVWAVAHTRKNNITGDVRDVAGNTQRAGQADTVLLLSAERTGGRIAATNVVFGKLREDPEEWPAPASLSIISDPNGERLLSEIDSGEDEGPTEGRILDVLRRDGPQTKRALKARLSVGNEKMEGALSTLFRRRSIETAVVQIQGRDRKAFQIRAERSLDDIELSELA